MQVDTTNRAMVRYAAGATDRGARDAAQREGDKFAGHVNRAVADRKPPAGEQKAETGGAPERPASPPTPDTKRPDGDTRSAQEIIKANPLLANLSEKDKLALKEEKVGIGDFEKDADAAYRASQVVHHLENYDERGNLLKETGDVGNDRVDGWTRADRNDDKSEAKHGTEAGRLQDFIRDGWGTLKGGPDRSAEQIIKDNPLLANLSEKDRKGLSDKIGDYTRDAKLASEAVRIMDNIEQFQPGGTRVSSPDIGNGKLDGWTRADRNDRKSEAQNGTEAGRFQDFLRSDKPANAYFKDFDTGVGTPKEAEKFIGDLQEDTYKQVIQNAKLPDDRQDLVKNPGKYTTEQRYAAQMELSLASKQLQDGAGKYYDVEGSLRAGDDTGEGRKDGWGLNRDPKKVVEEINETITKLDSPEVQKHAATAFAKATQGVLADDPGRRDRAESFLREMKDNAAGLGEHVGKDKNTLEGMGAYLQKAEALNSALGKDGKPLDPNLVINPKNSPQFDEIAKAYEKELRDPNTLKNLVSESEKKGMSREDAERTAFTELSSRQALFSGFGSPIGEIQNVTSENTRAYAMDTFKLGDVADSGITKPNGELDTELLTKSLETLKEKDPQNTIFKTDNGGIMTPGQLVVSAKAAWDGARNLGKINDKIGNVREIPLGQLFNKDGRFQKQLFATGAMHGVSALFAGGIIAARVGDTKGKLSPEALAATIGVGVQMVGVGTQAFEFTQRPNPRVQWGNFYRPGVGVDPPRTTVKQDLMNTGKTLNGLGGLVNGAGTIALGISELRKGNTASGALNLTLGTSNTITALGPLAEVGAAKLWQGLDAGTRTTNTARLFVYGGAASFALNVVGVVASIAGTIYGAIKQADHVKDQKQYFGQFAPTLNKYNIEGYLENPAKR